MADTSDVKTDEPVLKLGGAYKESDSHVPSPTDQFGTLDTTDTAGKADHSVQDVSPVFEAAKAQNLLQAARALDPEDTEVPSSLVILPGDDDRDKETAKEEILNQAKTLSQDKVEVSDETSPAKEQAADTDDDTDGQKTASVESQQQQQGAGVLGNAGPRQTPGTSPDANTAASKDEQPKVGADEAKTSSGDKRQQAQKQAQKDDKKS